MKQRWQRGSVILEEGHTGVTRKLVYVRPAIVVDDNEDFLALYFPVGYKGASADNLRPAQPQPPSRAIFENGVTMIAPTRYALTLQERVDAYMVFEPLEYRLVENTRWHVLYLLPHGAMHAVHLFWDPQWNLLNWFVNLQAPYTRTEQAIQTIDFYLDVVITPELRWAWKDEDEFDAVCQRGGIGPVLEQQVRDEGRRVIEQLEARQWPFNEPWPEWRPDPSWTPPDVTGLWSPLSGLRGSEPRWR